MDETTTGGKLPTGVYRRANTRHLWVSYYHHGRNFRESAKTAAPKQAEKFRARRLGELQVGVFVGPHQERVTVARVLDAYVENRKLAGVRGIKNIRLRIARLTGELGWMRAVDVSLPMLERWANEQLTRYARGTVKIDLAYLRAAFRIARRQGLVVHQPEFPTIAVDNVRQGFFERHEFEAVRAALAGEPHGEVLADIATFGYCSGWRLREILDLPWSEVDRAGGVIRLSGSRTKTGKPRLLALVGEMAALVERRWKARAVGQSLNPLVFHRDGRPIRDVRWAWNQACRASGVRRYFHDFRRTRVREMENAGVPRKVAMSVTGHVSESVYARYHIVTADDQRRALEAAEACSGERKLHKEGTMIRQGDVLLIPTTHKIAKTAKPVPRDRGRVVLAYGEATGHVHALAGPLSELFEENEGRLYLRLAAEDELRHVTDLDTFAPTTEHDPHRLAAGTYRVVRQQEYSPREIRRVSD